MSGGTGQEPVFDFMVVRPPDSVDSGTLRMHYIHDDTYRSFDTAVRREPRDLHTEAGGSAIGHLVFSRVACAPEAAEQTEAERLALLLDEVLDLVPPCADPCRGSGLTTRGSSSQPLQWEELDRYATVVRNGRIHVLPDRLDLLPPLPLLAGLGRVLDVLAAEGADPDLPRLVERLEKLLGAPLTDIVFAPSGAHTDDFAAAKHRLFDTLYLLYVLRRLATVSLERIIDGLRALHVLEALAVDLSVARIQARGTATRNEQILLAALEEDHPGLRGWDLRSAVPGFPLIGDTSALGRHLTATPVIHPVFARLLRYLRPFNAIKPIGVGDLKVVRQWLVAYRPGEISHIHNVLSGESKTRRHRRTERAEDTFSASESGSRDTTRDVQSTQRFEVKDEAEAVVKTTLGVTANATVTYQGTPVVASLTAGFAYNRASEDTAKTSRNFARDVIDKAVSRVASQTAVQRTTTRLTETEESNKQVFANSTGGHVSGMYRWVDKVYKAQVFNYGKRLMFEFLVPQPAAAWADAKLRAFTTALSVPQPPDPPVYDVPNIPAPETITAASYRGLRAEYDLEALPVPEDRKTVALRDLVTGSRYFAEKEISGADHSKVFECRGAGIGGYRAVRVDFFGYGEFKSKAPKNQMALEIADRLVWQETRPDVGYWHLDESVAPREDLVFQDDDTTLRLRFWEEIDYYDASAVLYLELTEQRRQKWQQDVHAVVKAAEEKKTRAVNQARQAEYERRLADYRDRLATLKSATVSVVLQGTSDAADKAVMDEEIKKHCLTLITKEFDSDGADDLLPRTTAMKTRKVTPVDTRFEFQENQEPGTGLPLPPTTARVETKARDEVDWPAIDIDAARAQGRMVQFLEQAFEWEHLSYLFYPYFWAEMPRWLELMGRSDDADPAFTAFLRAGMARVLVAVSPSYEDAVLHYLATREPWSGGPAPVIGDPLFVPLHEELRAQTDDRLGGTPDGPAWTFVVPTSLVYLHDSTDKLPDLRKERAEAAKAEQDEAAQAAADEKNGENP
ncbi:hypothetical protein [Yinghuangia soli]|uniref:Uncharacterized protein n=1 Tax=Yinghuangia soli TaxID=2908204 RepID=A0AA41Q0S5_9ACTN|nr:hypothetical protein [Yinghuangia soli]MCF2528860.1 hypothetical protein [Yinghuangia soli]